MRSFVPREVRVVLNGAESASDGPPVTDIFRERSINDTAKNSASLKLWLSPSEDSKSSVDKTTLLDDDSDDISELTYLDSEEHDRPSRIGKHLASTPKRTRNEVDEWLDLAHYHELYTGAHSRQVASALMNAAIACYRRRLHDALPHFDKTRRVLENNPDRTALAKCYYWYAKALFANKDLQRAEIYASRAYDIRRSTLCPLHMDTIQVYTLLAFIYLKTLRLKMAAKCLQEVITARKIVLGPRHPSVSATARLAARTYVKMKHPFEARYYFGVALEVARDKGMLELVLELEQEMLKCRIDPEELVDTQVEL